MSRKGTTNKAGKGKPSTTRKSGPPKVGAKKFNKEYSKKGASPHFVKKSKGDPLPSFSEDIRLNKFISNAGVCSRREADVYIQTGVVEVNGKVVQELGYKVKPGDDVRFDGHRIKSEKKQYVLLNKPKDFTVSSEKFTGRTVLQLTAGACKEAIVPVGKMDKMWTGLLLLTNDTDMMKRLTHPKYAVRSLYHVELERSLSPEAIEQMLEGIELEDGGFIKAEKVEILKTDKGRELGIEIKSNKNRAVERLVEAAGSQVTRLDRVTYGGLSKKDIPRGTWRHLEAKEIDFLKMI